MEEKKLGLGSVVSISVGLVIATSCLVSLGEGAGSIGIVFIFAMIIACLLNMTTVTSLSELNALMPDVTGGLAQYTLAGLGPFPTLISMVGGYLICNLLSCGVEASIFSYVGVIFTSVSIGLFAFISDGSSDMIEFLILVGSVFWMVSYVLAHIDVLVLRKRLPNAPRSFRSPGGILLPVIGIIGTVYMIMNISTDPVERMQIWVLTGAVFLIMKGSILILLEPFVSTG